MSLLRKNQFTVVLNCDFFQAEEREVGEYLVERHIISISSNGIALKEHFREDLEEILVANAAVKYLFNEDFFVWVLE